jgi:tetratricopeptide (TPR) repeat protein
LAVHDRERNQRVALKRLERIDPNSVYRFKQEFRGLMDIVHPNLVRLHELFARDQVWCFTMDYVDGVRFDTHVRGTTSASANAEATWSSADTRSATTRPEGQPAKDSTISDSGVVPSNRPKASFDEERLRAGLKQLAQGLLALHSAGILHRDLKPSNVLVDSSGRVVILDFGLAVSGLLDTFHDGSVAGTPAYMSPEQARGAPLTMASDWYAVGVMLYQALTGHLPFGGTVHDMLTARTTRDARDPRTSIEGLPDDLCELALALLKRDPAQRPNGSQIAHWVGIHTSVPGGLGLSVGGTFVGRTQQLSALHQAFATTRRGRTVVAHVHGASGFGKTTLIRRFLQQLALQDEVVILEGRCYERESVPFKAVDDLVDALGRFLTRLRPVEAAGLLPRDARALVRLFPSLGRLELMTTVPGRSPTTDPQELRRRAFAAVREVCARITDTRPLVLFIDDAHWGDADSAALLRNLLAPPEVPPLLLVVGYRGEDPDNELLRTLTNPAKVDAAWEIVDLPLGPLQLDEAEALAASLLGEGPAAKQQARSIAEESAQSPLFIAELVRALKRGGADPLVSMGRVVARRVQALPEDARQVAEVLACCARPLNIMELAKSSQLERERTTHAVDRLRDEHLVNVTLSRGRTVFEIFHDKVRQAVLEGINDGARRIHHERLAMTFEAQIEPDPETIASHYRAAGNANKTLDWVERAGDKAMETAATGLAVRRYREALDLAKTERKHGLMRKLARALADAGRGAQAAEAYQWLREHAPVSEQSSQKQSELLELAAEQYLRSGHVHEALDLYGSLLEQVGLALPKTPTGALMSLLWGRTRVKIRGTGFAERSPDQIPKSEMRKIDLCWVVGNGLQGIDLVRSAHYYTHNLLLSLELGEPYRVSRALSLAAVHSALESSAGVKRGEGLQARAEEIARRINDAHALGWAKAAQAVLAWGRADLNQVHKLVDEAVPLLRERSDTAYREIGSLQVWFQLHTLFLSGQLDRMAQLGPAVAREAEARGDRYTLSTVRAYTLPWVWATQDRPEEGRREAELAISVWPEDVWYHQHWAHLRALCFLDLYEGQGDNVLGRVQAARERMRQSMQLRIRTLRMEFNYLEGRGALEQMLRGTTGSRSISLVEQKIRRLDDEDNGLAAVYARALEAGLSAVTDSPASAGRKFARAELAFEQLGIPLHVAAAAWRRGECLKDDAAVEPISRARGLLEARGVKAPERFVSMLMPRVPNR